MVNSIIKASGVYVDTLHALGAIHPREMYELAIMMFLLDFKNKFVSTREELKDLNEIIDCMRRQGCLIKRVSNFNCTE